MIVKITLNKKNWINIESFEKLNEYLIKINKIKDLKSLHNIEYEVRPYVTDIKEVTFTELIANIKKMLLNGKKNGCVWRVEYWFRRGFSMEESICKVKNIQLNNGKKYDKKLESQGFNKKEIFLIKSESIKKFWRNKDIKYKREMSPRCLEFWLKKYDYKNAKIKCREFNDNGSLKYYIKTFGEDEGTKKYKEKGIKCSRPGKKNGMYAKPSPKGSGNGWSGWYNGFYFRSILELSYIYFLLENNIEFMSAETKKFRIKYIDFDKKERNYFPDFYLKNTNELIEVKPKKLLTSLNNKLKILAAKEKFGNKFKIITECDIEKLSTEKIVDLYVNKKISFIDRYDKKFKERFLNESN